MVAIAQVKKSLRLQQQSPDLGRQQTQAGLLPCGSFDAACAVLGPFGQLHFTHSTGMKSGGLQRLLAHNSSTRACTAEQLKHVPV